MFSRITKSLTMSLVSATFLASCGGGGSSDTTAAVSQPESGAVALPTTSIQGVFDGSIDASRPLTSLLLDDGSYYIVYSDATTPSQILGVVVGTGTANNGSFTSDNALNLSLQGTGSQSPAAATLTSSLTPKQSWNGFLTDKNSGQTNAFASGYNAAYESMPALAEIAGTYSGTMATKDARESGIELSITADGKLTGKLRCGCTVNATLVRQDGKLGYDATISFEGGTHPLAGKSMSGNVYVDLVTKRLYIVGKLQGSNGQVVFAGNKTVS